MTDQTTDMLTIEDEIQLAKSDVIEIFSDTKKLEPYLQQVADAVYVADSKIDLTTDKGRKAIGSRAHKVSKIKTQLSKIGKDSVADLKAKVSKVNQGIKFVEENLSSLRESTRAPLTAWQEEQDRIAKEREEKIKSRIQGIYELGALNGNETIDEVSSLLEGLSNIDCSEGFEEFTAEALKAVSETKNALTNHIQQLIAQEQQEKLNTQLAEEKRIAAINEKINELRMMPLSMMGKSSSEIKEKTKELTEASLDESFFQDQYAEAAAAKTVAIQQLNLMLEQQLTLEKTAASAPIVEESQEQDPFESDWAKTTRPVISATEVLSEHQAPTTDEQQLIASHIQAYCSLSVEQALLVAECLISSNVPFITFNRKAA